MSRRARIIVALCAAALLVVAALAVFIQRSAPSAAVPATASNIANVPLVRAAFGSFTTRIHAEGRIGAPAGGEAKLAFTGSGIVARIDVRAGQPVRAGQSLAELDTSGLQLDAAQARSDAAAAAAAYGGGAVPARALAGAQARLQLARNRLQAVQNGTGSAQSDRAAALAAVRQSAAKLSSDQRALDRATTLFAGGVAAGKDVDAARAALATDQADADANRARAASAGSGIGAASIQARVDLAQAQSDVRAAQAQTTVIGSQAAAARTRYAAAQRLLALATLTAPADGVVTAILKQPGEAVDPSQPAVVVGPPSSGEVTLSVAGAQALRVLPGAVVHVRTMGRIRSETGRVRSVVPSVDPATQMSTIVVRAVVSDAVPGDAVDATIDVARRRGIVIPTGAIVEDPQSGKSIVFVRERGADGSDKFVSREITVAAGDDERTLVAHGLRDGERVAAQGAFDLLAAGGGG